jgi:hypothetical protein
MYCFFGKVRYACRILTQNVKSVEYLGEAHACGRRMIRVIVKKYGGWFEADLRSSVQSRDPRNVVVKL